MIPITLSLLTLAALGVAQNTTVSLLLPALDDQSLVGSVLGADAKATTYVITCASGGGAAATTDGSKKKRQAAAMTTAMPTASPTGDLFDDNDSDECGLISPLTVTEGPSTLAYTLSLGDNVAVEAVSCVLSGTTKAVCGGSASLGSAAAASGISLAASDLTADPTATLTGSDLPSPIPVVITAGAEKLSGSAGTMTGSATNAGSTMTTGSAKAGGNSASKGSGTGTGTAAPASSTGGAGLGFEPVMGMGVAGAVAVGLGAILL